MQIACHSWSFNDLTLPEALGTIARLGFRAVDLGSGAHFSLSRAVNTNTRRALAEEIRGDLALFNLRLADVYVLLPRISLNDENARRTDIALFKAVLPVLKALEAPGVTLSPGVIHPKEDEEAHDRTVAALREMVGAAQKVSLPISIDPHLDSMASTPEQALALLDTVPGLRLTLDWAQFASQRIKPKDIAPLLPHVRHVQVRQAAPNRLQVPSEKGKIDLSEMIQMLREADYQGSLSIELMPAGRHGAQAVQPVMEALALRDTLREILAATAP